MTQLDEVGTLLRDAREASGLTVAQVSDRTRLRAGLVRDLERGDTESSGGHVYVRGRLRACAQATGSDPEPLLAAYARQAGVPQPRPVVLDQPLLGQPSGLLHLPTTGQVRRPAPQWALTVVLAMMLLAGLAAIGALTGSPTARETLVPASSPQAPPVMTEPAPAPSDPGASTQPPETPVRAVTPATAALHLSVDGAASWVRVASVGGATLLEEVLEPGHVQDFRDQAGLTVAVGNAGAVTLTCSTSAATAAGPQGQVRRFTCAPGGLSPV